MATFYITVMVGQEKDIIGGVSGFQYLLVAMDAYTWRWFPQKQKIQIKLFYQTIHIWFPIKIGLDNLI